METNERRMGTLFSMSSIYKNYEYQTQTYQMLIRHHITNVDILYVHQGFPSEYLITQQDLNKSNFNLVEVLEIHHLEH